MTTLQQAIAAVAKLPLEEQEWVAERWLAELEGDAPPDSDSSEPPMTLRQMAEEALADLRAGRTEELDPDAL